MPVKGNQFRTNSFKDDDAPRKPGAKAERPKPIKQQGERLPIFNLRDGRLLKITGLFFLVLSAFFLIAFTSYMFSWQQDQSWVAPANGGWANLFKSPKELIESGITNPIENWLGVFGALLANQFIYQWFGVASFLFVFIFFVIGFRLVFKIRLFSISKMLAYSLFGIVFISVSIGFIHAMVADYPHFLEGEFGYWSNRLLSVQIGSAGTGCVLIFAGLAVLVIAYNIDFKLPARKERTAVPIAAGDVDSEDIDLVDEDISLPVEWPRGNRARSTVNETLGGNAEKLQQVPLVQNTITHEPVVLTPEPYTPTEPEEDDEIPLTIDVVRPTPILAIEKSDDDKAKSLVDQFGMYDHTLELASYKYPTLDLLENYGNNKIPVNSDELEANKNKIVETLNHYNIEIDKIKATIGPTVTLYEIVPAPGVRISKIKNLEDDIALNLAALGIRIIAPMPGKGTIGIEVPNQHPEMVSMRSILATENGRTTPWIYL
jgi:S-DNA-T family DNA segregation ATPase FtsK/SpoIIIE